MRNYYETCLNSANDAIEIVYCDLIDEIVEATSTDGMDKKTLERIVSKKTSNLILSNLYSFENKNEYIFRKKRELVIKEETLFVYLLLKNIKEYSKADKEQFMTELEQRTEKEEIREILEKIRKNYSRGGRKEIEIDVLL
ncbi:hypothetical protein ECANGB1_1241 [Enterospora canceri]|uniref:Uncharacterized protein n=1 Tax=Enterospora canceri TaxID=1081671 RepID=A0A1Y1S6C6_9MICR|nr:hypothetical protein ECANGB1_1241 [Enterospora canceri]